MRIGAPAVGGGAGSGRQPDCMPPSAYANHNHLAMYRHQNLNPRASPVLPFPIALRGSTKDSRDSPWSHRVGMRMSASTWRGCHRASRFPLLRCCIAMMLWTLQCQRVAGTAHEQVRDLLTLYNATNGPVWRGVVGWTNATAAVACTWSGVTCDAAGTVAALSLRNSSLRGTIPSLPALATLT